MFNGMVLRIQVAFDNQWHYGEILNFMFMPENMDDREPLKQGKFLENIKGKLCADKGYIGQALF